MFEKFSSWLGSISKGWLVLVFFALDLLFVLLILPGAQAKIEAYSGGIGPLDLTFFPSVEMTNMYLDAYDANEAFPIDEGRAFYTNFELTVDLIYPIVYTFFFSLLISFLLRRSFDKTSRLHLLNLLPFGAWLFDLIENICIVILLSSFPAEEPAIATILMVANGIKWLFAGASILTVFFAFSAWIFRKVNAKQPAVS